MAAEHGHAFMLLPAQAQLSRVSISLAAESLLSRLALHRLNARLFAVPLMLEHLRRAAREHACNN
eukprot:3644483-Amphidinium_carterae.1